MSREVRTVPANWQHPKDERGRYRGLYDGDCSKAQADWDAGLALWIAGKRNDLSGGTEEHDERRDVWGWVAWNGDRPQLSDYMPQWLKEDRTHFMMYETTSEGTPISPAFETPEALAHWLADNNASGSTGASYEAWLRMARGGYAPSMVMTNAGLMSGVEALAMMETK